MDDTASPPASGATNLLLGALLAVVVNSVLFVIFGAGSCALGLLAPVGWLGYVGVVWLWSLPAALAAVLTGRRGAAVAIVVAAVVLTVLDLGAIAALVGFVMFAQANHPI